MIEFNKEDIIILDFIVSELVKGKSISANDLVKSGHIEFIDKDGYGTLTPEFDAKQKFKHYLFLLEAYDVCKRGNNKTDGDYALENSGTLHFQNNGGFSKKFEDLEKNKQREKDNDEILKLDLKLKKFESKIGKKLILFTFIIMLLSFLITILTLEFWTNEESKFEQKLLNENLTWTKFKHAIENKEINYLLKNSYDSIKCVDCIPDENDQKHLSEYIFKTHLQQLYNPEFFNSKKYSVYQNDSVI